MAIAFTFAMALRARLLAAKYLLEGAAASDEVSSVQSAAVLAQLQREPLNAEQAADLSVHILGVPWRCNHRELIMAALEHKASDRRTTQTKRPSQYFMTFIDFLTKMTWDTQIDPKACPVAKMDGLCTALVHLKCSNPNAHTLKLATSLHLFCTLGFDSAMSQSQSAKGKVKDYVSKEWHRHRRNVRIDPAHYLLKLPPRPADLQRVHPTIYGEIFNDIYGYPAQPPIPIAKVVAIYETFGCRNNDREKHHGAQSSYGTLAVPPTAANMPPQQTSDVMMCFFEFVQRMMVPPPATPRRNDIPIDYGPQGRGRLAGVARNLASSPISSDDADEGSPQGRALLELATAEQRFRRLATIDGRSPPGRVDAEVVGESDRSGDLSQPAEWPREASGTSLALSAPASTNEAAEGGSALPGGEIAAVAPGKAKPLCASLALLEGMRLRALQDTEEKRIKAQEAKDKKAVERQTANAQKEADRAAVAKDKKDAAAAKDKEDKKGAAKKDAAKQDVKNKKDAAKKDVAKNKEAAACIKRPASAMGGEPPKKRCTAGHSVEWSRNQVLARTGFAGPGQTKAFKFGGDGQGVEAATKAAEKWIKDLSK